MAIVKRDLGDVGKIAEEKITHPALRAPLSRGELTEEKTPLIDSKEAEREEVILNEEKQEKEIDLKVDEDTLDVQHIDEKKEVEEHVDSIVETPEDIEAVVNKEKQEKNEKVLEKEKINGEAKTSNLETPEIAQHLIGQDEELEKVDEDPVVAKFEDEKLENKIEAEKRKTGDLKKQEEKKDTIEP